MASWEVIMRAAEPHPDHPGGIVVSLTDGSTVSTYARVAWRRRGSRHPLHTFKRQLRDAIARAESEAERLEGGGAREAPREPDGVHVYGFTLDALRSVEAQARAEGVSVSEFVAETLGPSGVTAMMEAKREREGTNGKG